MSDWGGIIRRAFDSIVTQSAELVPRLLVSFVLVLLGVILAFLADALVRTLLRRAGLDRLAEQTGVGRLLARVGYENPASHLAGFAVFWVVLAVFLLSSADAMGLPAVSRMIGGLIAWLPPLALAMLVLVLALSLARTARRTIEGVAERSRMIAAKPIGAATYWLVLALGIVIALSGLGLDFTIVTAVVVVVLAALGVGVAVTLGLGSRDVARNTITGIYTRRAVRVGDRVRIGDLEGDVAAVGQVSVTLTDGARTFLVPYDLFMGSVVEVVRRGARTAG